MSIIWPHTGLTVPDTNAPHVADLTTTDGEIKAKVVDDHGTLGHIVNAPEDLIGTGLAFVPSSPRGERAMTRFMRATEELNDGPSINGVLVSLMVEEHQWQLEVDRAHRDQEYLVRYVCTELTWQTWNLTLDGEATFPDYSACRRLLMENPLGWAGDVVEAHMWAGDDGWIVTYYPMVELPQD